MPRPATDNSILFRWTLDAPAWDAFVRAVRTHPQGRRLKLGDASEAGRTMVVANDVLHVGNERADLAHFHVHRVVEHDSWLQLDELDPDYLPCPLPLPTDDAELSARLVEHFRQIAAHHTLQSALLAEQAALEASRPTRSNRLRWFVERHFVACLLVFFFVVLPLGSVLVAWLAGAAN